MEPSHPAMKSHSICSALHRPRNRIDGDALSNPVHDTSSAEKKIRPPAANRASVKSLTTLFCPYMAIAFRRSVRTDRFGGRAREAQFKTVVDQALRPRRPPTPVSFIRSTVPCSSKPARTRSWTYWRLRFSTTTDSRPARCSRCESISPAGPAPTIPTCVRIFAEARIYTLAMDSSIARERRLACGWKAARRSRAGILAEAVSLTYTRKKR